MCFPIKSSDCLVYFLLFKWLVKPSAVFSFYLHWYMIFYIYQDIYISCDIWQQHWFHLSIELKPVSILTYFKPERTILTFELILCYRKRYCQFEYIVHCFAFVVYPFISSSLQSNRKYRIYWTWSVFMLSTFYQCSKLPIRNLKKWEIKLFSCNVSRKYNRIR